MQLYRPHRKTAHRALQWHFLRFVPFNRRRYQTDTSGYNTACDTLERITAPQRLQHIPDTTVAPRRYTGQHSRPIIIMYIRVQRCAPVMDPCQTAQHIADHASGDGSVPTVCGSLASAAPCAPAEGSARRGLDDSNARRLAVWHRVSDQGGRSGTLHPAGQSSSKGQGGRRGTIGGSRRISFRAFAR